MALRARTFARADAITGDRLPPLDKQAILAEIRRTTAHNGGKPLGRDRFLAATGIRAADWEGRYWARWSDAVKEAGFDPNSLNASLDRDFVLEQYVGLIRKLQRVPVKHEFRMESRNNPSFPNDKTFYAHLGSKSQQLAKVRDYCEEHGYSDVLAVLPMPSTKPVDDSTRITNGAVVGGVYLMKSGRNYKLGRSNSVGRRQYEIGLQLPERHTLVHEIRTDDPAGIEAYWQKRFESRHMNGEWYALKPEDVAAFRRRKFM